MRNILNITAPGRVNLLGEHVDYSGGPVLPAAIDRYLAVEASPRNDGLVLLRALDLDESASFSLDNLNKKSDLGGKPLPAWALYAAGVAWALRQAGLPVTGLDATIQSQIPVGAGLSSSAALEAAFAVAWQAAGGWEIERMKLAQICLRAEREYVGLSCGILDQFAVLHGKAGHALFLETSSLSWLALPFPDETVIAICDSGQRRSLTNSAYNQRYQECQEALRLLRQARPELVNLADLVPEELAQLEGMLPGVLLDRARHVVEESHRARLGARLLRAGDLASFGDLMLASHASLRLLYEVSTPELDRLVGLAMAQPGCYGSRLTGAGFGGVTVSLVAASAGEDFRQAMEEAGYPTILCRPADAARVILM